MQWAKLSIDIQFLFRNSRVQRRWNRGATCRTREAEVNKIQIPLRRSVSNTRPERFFPKTFLTRSRTKEGRKEWKTRIASTGAAIYSRRCRQANITLLPISHRLSFQLRSSRLLVLSSYSSFFPAFLSKKSARARLTPVSSFFFSPRLRFPHPRSLPFQTPRRPSPLANGRAAILSLIHLTGVP